MSVVIGTLATPSTQACSVVRIRGCGRELESQLVNGHAPLGLIVNTLTRESLLYADYI